MPDPKQIDMVLMKLAKHWRENQDLNIGQLLTRALSEVNPPGMHDLPPINEDTLLEGLRRLEIRQIAMADPVRKRLMEFLEEAKRNRPHSGAGHAIEEFLDQAKRAVGGFMKPEEELDRFGFEFGQELVDVCRQLAVTPGPFDAE